MLRSSHRVDAIVVEEKVLAGIVMTVPQPWQGGPPLRASVRTRQPAADWERGDTQPSTALELDRSVSIERPSPQFVPVCPTVAPLSSSEIYLGVSTSKESQGLEFSIACDRTS